MHNRLLFWINGYVKVKITGTAKERFINLCKSKGIVLKQIEYKSNFLTFYIAAQDFKGLRQVVNKTKTHIVIQKKTGLPFVYFRYRKRQPFFLGVMLGVFLMYIASLYIWNISFSGQSRYTYTTLSGYLKSIGIDEGMLKKKVSCNDIEEMIRGRYPDIGWVSAQIKGTRLIICLKENIIIDNTTEHVSNSITSDCDGTIRYIYTRAGTPVVKAGDSVNKGDLLIDGNVKAMDESGNELEIMSGIADGDIFIDTDFEYNNSFSRVYLKKKYRKNVFKYISIIRGKDNYSLRMPIKSIDNCDIIVNDFDICLFEDFILPIGIRTKEYREYSVEQETYSDDEALLLAENIYNEYIKSLLKDKYIVNSSTVKSFIKGDEIITSGNVSITKKVNTAAN